MKLTEIHKDKLSRLATSRAGVGVWIWDVDTNELYWDDSMYELYGLSEEDHKSAFDAWLSSVHPEDARLDSEKVQKALESGASYESIFRINTPGGQKCIQSFGFVERKEDGTGSRIYGVNWDVSKVQIEMSKFKSIVESSLDAIFIYKPVVRVDDGKFINEENILDFELTELNERACQMLSMSKDEATGLQVRKEHPFGQREQFFDVLKTVYIDKKPLEEYSNVQDTYVGAGDYLNYCVRSEDVVIVFSRNITEENKNRRERVSLAKIAESSTNAVLLFDGTGRVTWANETFCELSGYDLAEVVGGDIDFLQHAATSKSQFAGLNEECTFADLTKSIKEQRSFVGRLVGDGKSGNIFILDIKGWVLRSEDVSFGYAVTGENVTEKSRLSLQLLMQEKMTTVGMLSAGVAHEINNPLAIAKGNLHLLQKNIHKYSAADQLAKLKMVYESVSRIEGIVKGLRDFSRMDTGEKSSFEIDVAIAEALTFMEVLTTKAAVEVEFVKDDADGFYLASGQSHRFQQVFVNLLKYSIDAFNDHPVMDESFERRVKISLNLDGEFYKISYEDSGPPIPEGEWSKVFEPFYLHTVEKISGGLGLSICLGIIDSLGGSIKAGNSELGGAGFYVELPKPGNEVKVTTGPTGQKHTSELVLKQIPSPPRPDAVTASSGEMRDQESEKTKDLKVLIIDDEVALLDIFQSYSEDLGYASETTDDPQVVLELVKAGSVDILISDNMMPKMSGSELINRALKVSSKEICCILMSAGEIRHPNTDVGFLEKPFDPAEMEALLLECENKLSRFK